MASLLLAAGMAQVDTAPSAQTQFDTSARAEALATITVTCELCAWAMVGREAVVLSLALDGRYVQHLPVVRRGRAEYRVMLGRVEPGRHTLVITEDAALTAAKLRGGDHAVIETVEVTPIADGAGEYTALSLAPIVYARRNSVGRFTDVPVLMWYEQEATARGTRYRYSVIFTNEDGGTPADRLMATWGRSLDLEYLYSVEVDANGQILDDDIQGPDHEILRFTGRREGRHPLVWVATANNMVLPKGRTRVRYAPVPILFPLVDVSREAVVDAHPWLYALMAQELAREGKIVAGAPPGTGAIPDPRRFVFFEGCGELDGLALTLAVRVGETWLSSDRGVPEYRIARNGCYRGAIPLPEAQAIADVATIRVQVFPRKDSAPDAAATLTRINRVFALDDAFVPGPSILQWQGTASLRPGDAPFELAVP